jgi:hypothetical protein
MFEDRKDEDKQPSCEVELKGSIDREINRLEKNVNFLLSKINLLEKRVKPVIANNRENSQNEQKEDEETPNTELGKTIREINLIVENSFELLLDVINGIEL